MKWISNLRIVIQLAFITSMISCGMNGSKKNSAPTTKDQAGIIASCTTAQQAEQIAQNQGISYRVINEKAKLIEFIGIDKEHLREILPKAKFKKNTIYDEILISGNFPAQSITNKPFYGAHTRVERSPRAQTFFPHLEQINALGLENNQGDGVVIAIVDTGVYYNHPHLSPNIRSKNTDQHGDSSDGIDNDNNGYKDDQVGWDFYNGDAYPIDDNGHGTHVAGLAASTFMGIAPKAKILPIKVLSNDGRGDLGTITAGILYALDNGADIVNMSLGGSNSSGVITKDIQDLINSIKVANSKGKLIIAAAGNGGSDNQGDCNDTSPVYPATIQETNMIAVAAVDGNNNITKYSNYGGSTVHAAAPGGDDITGKLASTGIPYCQGACPQSADSYVYNAGTSMATPIVAGIAALVMSENKSLTPEEVRNIIMKSGEYQSNLDGIIKSKSVVDVAKSIEAAKK